MLAEPTRRPDIAQYYRSLPKYFTIFSPQLKKLSPTLLLIIIMPKKRRNKTDLIRYATTTTSAPPLSTPVPFPLLGLPGSFSTPLSPQSWVFPPFSSPIPPQPVTAAIHGEKLLSMICFSWLQPSSEDGTIGGTPLILRATHLTFPGQHHVVGTFAKFSPTSSTPSQSFHKSLATNTLNLILSGDISQALSILSFNGWFLQGCMSLMVVDVPLYPFLPPRHPKRLCLVFLCLVLWSYQGQNLINGIPGYLIPFTERVMPEFLVPAWYPL